MFISKRTCLYLAITIEQRFNQSNIELLVLILAGIILRKKFNIASFAASDVILHVSHILLLITGSFKINIL